MNRWKVDQQAERDALKIEVKQAIASHTETIQLLVQRTRDLAAAQDEIKRLQAWMADLQAGMYINCVYCGYRYGPANEVSASMADVLKAHIEQCPKHPMSALKTEVGRLKTELSALKDVMRVIVYGACRPA